MATAALMALLGAAALIAAPPVAQAQNQTQAQAQTAAGPARTLTLPQARAAADAALRAGKFGDAEIIAKGLLLADPDDAFAHLVLAAAAQGMGRWTDARTAARTAYYKAEARPQRHQAAQIASRAAFQDKRTLAAQLWLRRAVEAAPNGTPVRAQTEARYRALRRASPYTIFAGMAVSPSSNVNNGAETRFNRIEGLPFVGFLSPDAQALSGIVAQGRAGARIKLSYGKRHLTTLTPALSVTRVFLSEDAQEQSPTSENADFARTDLSLRLAHAQTLQSAPKLQLSYGASLGRGWRAGDLDQSWAELSAGAALRDVAGGIAQAQVSRRVQRSETTEGLRAETNTLRLGWQRSIGQGHKLSAQAFVADTSSNRANARKSSKGASLTFAPDLSIGPARLSLTLGATQTHYEDYAVGFFAVPGGRTDTTRFGRIAISFDDWDYAGFTPTVGITTSRTTSNVSRFDTQTTGVSFGIRSSF